MRPMRFVSLAILAVGVAVAAGCDDESATPPAATGTQSQTQTEAVPETGDRTTSVAVYFLRDGRVSPVRRTIAATPAVARAALTELFEGPTDDEAAAGLVSVVPAGTTLRDISLEDGTATVDLDGAFDDGGGSASMQGRIAQVVATLTRFPTIERVAFRLDGEPVEAIGGEGLIVDPPVGRAAIEGQTPQILVESPLPGDSVASPIRLRGTANVFEATVSIEVRDEHGDVVLRTFTTATSGNGTRGTFDTELPLPSTSGNVTIKAFEASAEDGRPLHEVDVPVTLGR